MVNHNGLIVPCVILIYNFHKSDFHDFHNNYFNNSNHSKDSNIYNTFTDTFLSSKNLEKLMDKSKYVVFNYTIMWNQDLTTFQ